MSNEECGVNTSFNKNHRHTLTVDMYGCGGTDPADGHMHEVHFWEVEPASGDEAPGHAHTIPQASRWEDFDAD
jgi:hypothetical protein